MFVCHDASLGKVVRQPGKKVTQINSAKTKAFPKLNYLLNHCLILELLLISALSTFRPIFPTWQSFNQFSKPF